MARTMMRVLVVVALLTPAIPANAMQTERRVQGASLEDERVARARREARRERIERRERREAARAAAEAEAQADAYVAPPTSVPGDIDWLAIAACESGGNWHIDSTYDGGLQFHPDTWLAAGGGRYAAFAYLATPSEQIATAENWVSMTGCVACSSGWPNCGRLA